MDKRPRRKFDHEKIIYFTVDFALDIIKNVAKGLSRELEKKIDNYSGTPENELIETSKDLIARIKLPGVPKEDIDIDLTEKKLKIKVGHVETDTKIMYRGRNNKLKKEIRLPKRIVVEESAADLEEGVLTVTMPKKVRRVKYEVPVD